MKGGNYIFLCKLGVGIFFLLLSTAIFAQNTGFQLHSQRQNNFTYSLRYNLADTLRRGKYELVWQSNQDNILNTSLLSPWVQLYIRNHFWQYYRLNPKWRLTSWVESDLFLHIGNHRTSVYTGLEYTPITGVSIVPMLGYSWDLRAEKLDKGVSPALLIRANHTWEDGLKTSNKAFLRVKNIDPRKQQNLRAESFWQKKFGEFAEMNVGIIGARNEMDDYKSSSVERIISDTLAPVIELRYRPANAWEISSSNSWQQSRRRFIYVPYLNPSLPEFNNLSFNQSDMQLQQAIRYEKNRWSLMSSYTFERSGRAYLLSNTLSLPNIEYTRLQNREAQKDFIRTGHTFLTEAAYRPNLKQTLRFSFSNKYVQFDTPSQANFDDHDELNYGAMLNWEAIWRKNFRTRWQLAGNVRKYAFLFKERSQDNYTQDNLRMEWEWNWQPVQGLNLKGEQYIYVTYNAKDFYDLNFTDRSTRNLESKLEGSYAPSKSKWIYSTTFYRRETQLAYFNKQNFSETPFDTTRTHIIEARVSHAIFPKLKNGTLYADVGMKHFTLNRFQNASMMNLQNFLKPINLRIYSLQTGPTLALRWMNGRGELFNIWIWWQYQRQWNRYKELSQYSGSNSTYKEADLRLVQTYFRPYFNVQLNLNHIFRGKQKSVLPK